MLSVVLIDDEKNSLEVLALLLKKYADKIRIVATATNANDGYDVIMRYQPDLIFLDVKMPREDGLSMLKRFNTISFEIIFITSYNQFAINAIKFNALDYLLKPVDTNELDIALQKVFEKINQKESSTSQVVNLINYLDDKNKYKKIAAHANDKVKLIAIEDIIFVEADGRYCIIHEKNEEKFIIAKNLKDVESYLKINSNFVRVSKSILINTTFIKSYSKSPPYFIEMTNGMLFEIPRRKKTEILEKIK